MEKMIYNYIRNDLGDKIGIVVARKGSCPGRYLIGWALAEDIILEPNKYYVKLRDCKVIADELEILKKTVRNLSSLPEGILSYIEAKCKIEDIPESFYNAPVLKAMTSKSTSSAVSQITKIIQNLENLNIPRDRILEPLCESEAELNKLQALTCSPVKYNMYYPSTGSNDYIINNKELRKKVLDLALSRSNYDSWNYYCDKESEILEDCNLRRGVITTGEDTVPMVYNSGTKKQKNKYYDFDRACIIRQAVRKIERRAYKYFK